MLTSILGQASPPYRLKERAWFSRLDKSTTNRKLGLPDFPSEALQAQWVGSTGVTALHEVHPFYRKIKERADFTKGPLLDFGIGWGRVSRFFLNDLPPSDIHGVDINPHILAECRKLSVPGDLRQIDPLGTLPYADRFFSVVYAYSVFSHLAEAPADHWAAEIFRVLTDGGYFFLTVFTEDELRVAINGHNADAPQWQKERARQLADRDTALARYRAGQHLFAPLNAQNTQYGIAFLPLGRVQQCWPFEVVDYTRNLGAGQGLMVLQKVAG